MLNRYPDQTKARKGFALVGVIFFLFGIFMALLDSVLLSTMGIIIGLALLLPAFFLSHLAFVKYEKVLLWLF